MTNYVDGAAALATFSGYSNLNPAHCLEYVWDAYHAHGAQSNVTYPYAEAARQASPGFHPGDMNPPIGMPVWFGPNSHNGFGDVAISAGGGMIWAVWNTGVHEVSIAQRAAEIDRPYEGWSEGFMTDNIIVPGVGRNITARATADVQTKLGITADGSYGPQTTYFVRKFQGQNGLQVDGIYGPMTDAALFPNTPLPGVVAEGFDASSSRPSPAAVLAAGRTFIVVYVGAYDGDPRAVTKAEVDAYLNAGVSVVFVYEGSGKDATSFQNGAGDANYAQGRLVALGYPDAKCYFAVDEQFAPDPIDYFKGVESVIGHARAGEYGSLDTLTAVQGAGLCSYHWLTYGWLNGRGTPDWIHLFQYLNTQVCDGHAVDYDHAMKSDYGQVPANSPTVVPPPTPPVPVAPPFPLPAGYYFGPKSGPVQSVSGYFSHRADLQRWQQRMKDRGWAITPDGLYGPQTQQVTTAFQKQKGLKVDGLIGPATWAAAWTAPVTP